MRTIQNKTAFFILINALQRYNFSMTQGAVKATYGDLKRIIFPFGNLWELSNRLRCFHQVETPLPSNRSPASTQRKRCIHPTETMQKKGASPRQVNRIVHYLGEF